MVAVLLLPVALILAVCLLDLLERRVVAEQPAARTAVARPGGGGAAPVAPVVSLHGGVGAEGVGAEGVGAGGVGAEPVALPKAS